jgi:hypothetical protein
MALDQARTSSCTWLAPLWDRGGHTKYCVRYKTKISPLLSSEFCSLHSHQPSYISVRFTLQGVELIAMESFKDQGIVTGTLRMTGVRSLLGFVALPLHLDVFR